MKVNKLFKFAGNLLLHSKLRSWLTIVGIVIGVAAIIAIVSLGTGLQESVSSQLGGLGADIISVSPGFSRAQGFRGGGGEGRTLTNTTFLDRSDLQTIKSEPGISFVDPIVSGSVDMTYLGETVKSNVQGVDESVWKNFVTTNLESGRYLSAADSNVIVISNRLAHDVFKNQIYINKPIMLNGKLFRVVGIFEKSSGAGGGLSSYVPLFQARSILTDKPQDHFDTIAIKVANVDELDGVAADLKSKLQLSRHVTDKNQDFTVSSSKDVQQQVQQVIGTFTLFLAAIAAVSLIVGAVGVANTMFTSVLEKTKEIGILKAIGARNSDILAIFLFNSGLVGLVGGIIGALFGWGLSLLLPMVVPALPNGRAFSPHVTWSIVLIALLVAVFIGMISGVVPAYRASNLKPVDALRYE